MLIFRTIQFSNLRTRSIRVTPQILNFSSDDKKSSEQNESTIESNEKTTNKSIGQKPEESAADKLNRLLASMQTNENITLIKKVEIPKAGGREKFKKEKKPKGTAEVFEKNVSNLVEAAKNVADTLIETDETKKKIVESELLGKLLHGSTIDSSNQIGETNLKNLIVGMKIDRDEKSSINQNRGQFVRQTINRRQEQFQDGEKKKPRSYKGQQKTTPVPFSGSVNLFGEKPLDIFTDTSMLKESQDLLTTWNHLEQRELKLAVTHPPVNYFQKMILWTEQGKLWKFPIDNEQGLEKEAEVDFSEHIFLEQHLENWCPTKGPIRHFMELVCVGLSKNPYITAQEKRDHILWYRDYFEKKKDILKDLIIATNEAEKQKSIKSLLTNANGNIGQINQTAQFHSKSSDILPIAKDTKGEEVQNDKNKLVFLGHSCIWVPSSPAKTGNSDHLKLFSTSASSQAESAKEKHLNEAQAEKGNKSNLKKDIAQQVCETKPDLDANVSIENLKNAKMSINSSTNLLKNENKSGPIIRIKPNTEQNMKKTSASVEKHETKSTLNSVFDQKIKNSAEPNLNWKNKIDGSFAVSSPPTSNVLLTPKEKVNSIITARIVKKINEDKQVENSLILDKSTNKIKKTSKDFGEDISKNSNKEMSSIIGRSKQKLENDEDKKLVFVGHSATWIPSQAKPEVTVTIPNNKKQIFFVGHSCTWVPENSNMLPEFLEKFAIKKPRIDVIEVKEKAKVNTSSAKSKITAEIKITETNLNDKEKIKYKSLNNRDKNLKSLGEQENTNVMLSFEQFKEKQSVNYKKSATKLNEKIVEVEKSNGIRYIPRTKTISNESVILSSKKELKNENIVSTKINFTESNQWQKDKNTFEKNFLFLGHPVAFEKGSWILQLEKTPNAQEILKLSKDDETQQSKSNLAKCEAEDKESVAKKSAMISLKDSKKITKETSIHFIGHSIAWLPKELEIKTKEKPKLNQLNIVGSLNELADKTNQEDIVLHNQDNKAKIQDINENDSPNIAELHSKFKSEGKSKNIVLNQKNENEIKHGYQVKPQRQIQPKPESSTAKNESSGAHKMNPINMSGSSVEPKIQQKSSASETKYLNKDLSKNNPALNEENPSDINQIIVESKVENQVIKKSADIRQDINEKKLLKKSSNKVSLSEFQINEANSLAAFDLENWMEDKLLKSENKKRKPFLAKKINIVTSTLKYDSSTNTNKIITRATGVPMALVEKNNISSETTSVNSNFETNNSKRKEEIKFNKSRLPTTFDIAIKKIDEVKKLSAKDIKSSTVINLTSPEQIDKKNKFVYDEAKKEMPKSDISKETLTPIRIPPNAEQIEIFSSAISDTLKAVKLEKLEDRSFRHSVNDKSIKPAALSEKSANQSNNSNLQKINTPKLQTVADKKQAKEDQIEKPDSKKLSASQQNKSYKETHTGKFNTESINEHFPVDKHESKLNVKKNLKFGTMEKNSTLDLSAKQVDGNQVVPQKQIDLDVEKTSLFFSDSCNQKIKRNSLEISKPSLTGSNSDGNINAKSSISSEMQKRIFLEQTPELPGRSNINKLKKDQNATEAKERNKMSNGFILIKEASTNIKKDSTSKLPDEKGFVLIKESKVTQSEELKENGKQLGKSIADHVEAVNLMKQTDIVNIKLAAVSTVVNEDIEKNLKKLQAIGNEAKTNIKQLNDMTDQELKNNLTNFNNQRSEQNLNQKFLNGETERTAEKINEIHQITKPLKGKNVTNLGNNDKTFAAGEKKEKQNKLTPETQLQNDDVSNLQILDKTSAGKKKEKFNAMNSESQSNIVTNFEKDKTRSFAGKKEEKLSNTYSEKQLTNSNKNDKVPESRKFQSNRDGNTADIVEKKTFTKESMAPLTNPISNDEKQQSIQKDIVEKYFKGKKEKTSANVLPGIVVEEKNVALESDKIELEIDEKKSNLIAKNNIPIKISENLELNENKPKAFEVKNTSPFSRWIDNTLETEHPTKLIEKENDNSKALRADKRQPEKQTIGKFKKSSNTTETTKPTSQQKDDVEKSNLKKFSCIGRESNDKNQAFQMQKLDSQKVDEIIKESANAISSIVQEKVNDAVPKTPKPENIFETSKDIIENKSPPKKGLIVEKSLGSTRISTNDNNPGISKGEIEKQTNLNKVNSDVKIIESNSLSYKAKSPLERIYNEIDQKIDDLQKEIAEMDKKTKVTIRADLTIKPDSNLKSTLSDNQLRDLKLARSNFIEHKDKKIQKSEDVLKLNFETLKSSQTSVNSHQNQKIVQKLNLSNDIEQNFLNETNPTMLQERKPYIPFSFEISRSVKGQLDAKSEQRKEKLTSPIVEQYKSYFKPSDINQSKISPKKTTLFQELKTMIKEDLFSNPELLKHQVQVQGTHHIKEINAHAHPNQGKEHQDKTKSPSKEVAKEEKSNETILSVESCASQPNIDGSMKPTNILTEIKTMIKEELFTHPSENQKIVDNNLKVSKKENSVVGTLKIVEQSNNVEILESNVQNISKSSTSKLSENMIPISISSPSKENHILENVKIEAKIEKSSKENTSKMFTDLDEKEKQDLTLGSEVKENLAQNQLFLKKTTTVEIINNHPDKKIIEQNVIIPNTDKNSLKNPDNLSKRPETLVEQIKYLFNLDRPIDSSQVEKKDLMPIQKSENLNKQNIQEFLNGEPFVPMKTSDLTKENDPNPIMVEGHSIKTNIIQNSNNDSKKSESMERKQESLVNRIKYLLKVDKSSKPENITDTAELLRIFGEKESVEKNIQISGDIQPKDAQRLHSNIEHAREKFLKPLKEKTNMENNFKIKENNSPDSSPTHKFLDHKLIEQERSKLLNIHKVVNTTEKQNVSTTNNNDGRKPPKLSLDLDQISEFKILPDTPPSPLIEKINSTLNKKTKLENEINLMTTKNDNSKKMGSIEKLNNSNKSEEEIQPFSEFQLAYNKLKNYFTSKTSTVEKYSQESAPKATPITSILDHLMNLNTEEIKIKQNLITSGTRTNKESELTSKKLSENLSNSLSVSPSKVVEESNNSGRFIKKTKSQTESNAKEVSIIPEKYEISLNEINLKHSHNIPEILKSTSTKKISNNTTTKNVIPSLDDGNQEKQKIPKKNKTDDEKRNFDVFSKIINTNLGNHLDNKDYPKTRANDTKNSTSLIGETIEQKTKETSKTNKNLGTNLEKSKDMQKHKTNLDTDKDSDKKSVVNFSSLNSTSNITKDPNFINSKSGTVDLDLDRYNSFEANPFSKNQVLVKILCALKLASIRKD